MKKWIQITRDEYFSILKKYRSELTVFSSATWPDYVSTEWGFKKSKVPSIRAHSTSMNPAEAVHTYFKYKTVKVK